MKLSGLQISLELGYQRRGLFAMELLDGATRERVFQGIKISADGLLGKPVLNSSGVFVWLDEDFTKLKKIIVQPEQRPYEPLEIPSSQIKLRSINPVELSPVVGYPFPSGLTGLRGRLIEQRVAALRTPTPVVNAAVRLQWRSEDNDAWRDSPTLSHTTETGEFASFLRLTPTAVPQLDPADGRVLVRLRVSRAGQRNRTSAEFKLAEGRITNPTPDQSLMFAWSELSI